MKKTIGTLLALVALFTVSASAFAAPKCGERCLECEERAAQSARQNAVPADAQEVAAPAPVSSAVSGQS